jgi:hypothetical protein
MMECASLQVKNLKSVKKPTDEMINKSKVTEIRKAFNCRERFSITEKLFTLTKFNTNGPQLSLNEIRSRAKNRRSFKKILKKNELNDFILIFYYFLSLRTY